MAFTHASLKSKDFERARSDYAAALKQFNLYRRDYFSRTLPLWAQAGYQLGKDRYARTQTLFNVLYERVRVAVDRMNTVGSELQNLSNMFQPEQDMESFLSRIRTGTPCPGDISFVDLATAYPISSQVISFDSGSEKSNTYCAPNWPANFYPSVSAADFAALENAGLVRGPQNDGPIYAGTGSLYSTLSTAVSNGIGAVSRKSSISSHAMVTSPSSHGAGLLRRFFSRRSRHDLSQTNNSEHTETNFCRRTNPFYESAKPWRHQKRCLRRKSTLQEAYGSVVGLRPTQSTGSLSVANMKLSMDGAGEADYVPNSQRSTNYRPSNRVRDLLDSSDFSDTSFESDKDVPEKKEVSNAYATTSVLMGLNRESRSSDKELPPTQQNIHTPAPLAQPESVSLAPVNAGRLTDRDTVNIVNGHSFADECAHRISHTVEQPELVGKTNYSPGKAIGSSLSAESIRKESDQGSTVPISSVLNGRFMQHNSRLPVRPPPMSINRKAPSDVESTVAGPTVIRPVGQAGGSVAAHLSTQRPGLEHSSTPQQPPASQAAHHSTSSSQISICDRRQSGRHTGGQDKHFYPRKLHTRSSPPHDTAIVVGACTALYPFTADGFESCYLRFEAGDRFYTLAPSVSEDTTEWIRVLKFDTYEPGYVPTAFVEQERYAQPLILPTAGSTASKTTSCSTTPVHKPTRTNSGHPLRATQSAVNSPITRMRLPKNGHALMNSPVHSRLAGTARDTEL
ncbi:SH3 domain protein [Paragonimus westermani]|uniref:SH3 domain protein n=1 Tax=Paragonimus westermani TaxID=34504 RepID=A0A8T0DVX8_9TREM|nr:SH3 domain protein [Paragonimus westermani]